MSEKIHTSPDAEPRKICILGAGLVGLGYLQALLHLPEEARKGWEIDCYERRGSPGGIWHPQPNPPSPPEVPETPAYDDVECISLGSGMTFPNRPMPPSTLLFPKLETLDTYIQTHVRDFGLSPYIHLGHSIIHATLDENVEGSRYPWTITVQRKGTDGAVETITKKYSTFIVGNGVICSPRFMEVPGENDWLEGAGPDGKREMIHSMWYRNASIAKGRFVVVIGNHPSGNHIAKACCEVATEVHHIYTTDLFGSFFFPPVAENYHQHSTRVSGFTTTSILLADGTSIPTPPDALVIQSTGYWRDHPFLPDSLLKRVKDDNFTYTSASLQSNNRYLRPLYKNLLPFDPKIPYGSMAFACLYPIIWNFPTSYAQGLWFAHLLADLDANGGTSAMLPDREKMMQEVRDLEQKQVTMGHDMAKVGYLLVPPGKATDDITDHMIREVRQHSKYALPEYLQDPAREYTEPWRRKAFEITLPLWAVFQLAKKEGVAASFTEGATTEEDFAEAMEKLRVWGEQKKLEEGLGDLKVNGA